VALRPGLVRNEPSHNRSQNFSVHRSAGHIQELMPSDALHCSVSIMLCVSYRRIASVLVVMSEFSVQEKSMPSTVDTAAQLTCSLLNNPNCRPTIVIIDALNQVHTCCCWYWLQKLGQSRPFV